MLANQNLSLTSRPVHITDKPLIEDWISKDFHHSQTGRSWGDLVEPKTESYLLSANDFPLMAVRLHNALRVAIQFNPEHPYRSARHAKEIMIWLKERADKISATEMIIRPGGLAVNFAEHLGWEDFSGKFFKVGG